jgi:GWxTD domain-containing protein
MRRIAAPPGSYRIDVTLEDIVDGRKASRAQGVTIRDPALTGPALGRISLLNVRRDGTAVPQISFFVPMRSDSIPCTVRTYDFSTTSDSRVGMCLLRYPADTGIAVVPFYYPTVTLPTGHSLVDFGSPDTAFQEVLSMRPPGRIGAAEFRIPPLPEGLYRFDCLALTQTPSGADTLLSASRYYSIKGPGFPRPVTYAELIAAAVYIATNREIAALRSAHGAAEQRKNFEEFWLSLAGGPSKAASLIRNYYGRVEEANRLFTIVKEGWRTDRGMLYCVLGPPSEISNRLDTQTWYYDLPGNAGENIFVFKHVMRQTEGLTVEDYLLYRQSGYESFWNRMVFKWRSGENF